MPEAATGGVLRKRVFFRNSLNLQETLVPEETSVTFAKFFLCISLIYLIDEFFFWSLV